jgi:hypothetical protein
MRVLIAVDVNDDDRETADATRDEIAGAMAATLHEVFPSGPAYPVRVRLAHATAYADLTEGWQTFLDMLQVGLDGAPGDLPGLEDAEIAYLMLSQQA